MTPELATEFNRVRTEGNDISGHCDFLASLAAIYSHITEMGVRYGSSTIAFLAGGPRSMVSYDLRCQIDIIKFKRMAGDCDFKFVIGDSLKVEIANTDVLLLDTHHNYQQVYAELCRHAEKVRHQIVIHDTETFPDTMNAIDDFLKDEGKHWKKAHHYPHDNGLTVLSRVYI